MSSSCSAIKASGLSCTKHAYFRIGSQLLCGQHSRRDSHKRVALPKAKKPPFDLDAQIASAKDERGGQVKLQRMGMMKAVTQEPGWICVFPNFKHANRKDGIGLAELSPMNLGPVDHGQPGLPPAKTLESFWQFSKRFASETDDAAFHQSKVDAYLDPTPRRHKIKGEKPLYWSWIDPDGTEHKLDYITARQFYCIWYELLASGTDAWMKLHLYAQEFKCNTQICGYDAFPIEPTKEAIMEAYLDPSHPFGHERVLFAMLVLEDREDYPWRVMSTPHLREGQGRSLQSSP